VKYVRFGGGKNETLLIDEQVEKKNYPNPGKNAEHRGMSKVTKILSVL
jgi:hypothetical protein